MHFAGGVRIIDERCEARHATVAQSVEQLIRNQQVAGSSPASSSMIADEKAARQKNHEKRTFFHGFLLFMR